MNWCSYKDILGKPGVGFHNHFGYSFAVLDFTGTVGIAYYLTRRYRVPFVYSFSGLMLTAITLHKVFCVDTVLNNYLFGMRSSDFTLNKD